MKIDYAYQWRNALAEAIRERDVDKVDSLGAVTLAWLGSEQERESYRNLISAIVDILDEIED